MSSLANIAGRLIQIHRSLAEPPSPVPLSVDRVSRVETRVDYGHPSARPRLARGASRVLHAPTPAAAARWPSLEASTLLEDAVTRFKLRASRFPDVPKVDGWLPAGTPSPPVDEPSAPPEQPEAKAPVAEPPVIEPEPTAIKVDPPFIAPAAACPEPPVIEPSPPTVDPEAIAAWILIHLGELLSRMPVPAPPSTPPREEPGRDDSLIQFFPPPTPPEPISESPVIRVLPFPGAPDEFRFLDAPGVPAELLRRPERSVPVRSSPPVSEVVHIRDVPDAPETASGPFNPLDWLLVPDVDRSEPSRHAPLDWFPDVPALPEEPVHSKAVNHPPLPPPPAEPDVEAILGEPLYRLFSPPVEVEPEDFGDEAPHWLLAMPTPVNEDEEQEELVDEIPHWLFSVPNEPEDEPNPDEPMDWLYSAPAEPLVMRPRGEPQRPIPPASAPAPASPTDEQIRRRAYALWQAAGSPPSDGREFWIAALRDLGLAP